MCPEELFERYRDLQHYLHWSTEDRARVVSLVPLLEPHISGFVEDFYREVQQHPETRRVLTGGSAQIVRLKISLRTWLQQLFSGQYDLDYVQGRWRVGLRHAEIGLHQVYTNMALSRLRAGMHRVIQQSGQPDRVIWPGLESLNKLLDLDLAIIEDSYEFHRLKQEKQVERERSERKFRNLVEAAACMIVILRDDLSVLYFSPFAERLSGYSAEEVEQKSFVELFAGDDADAPGDPQWLAPSQDLPVSDIDMPIRCRDGSQRWLVWNAIRLEDFDGKPAVLAVGHDITEKRRSAEKLLQSERLAAIGQTITGLAHESRNALQRINSCTEMLEFEVEDNAEAMQLIRRSQQAQDDLARLFDEVRNFAAPITLDVSPCHLAKIWREAWTLVQPECRGRDVAVQEDIDDDNLVLHVDRFRLVQVFRNLLENSLAACSDPVRIDFVCRSVPPADAASLPELELRIRDNGPGLDPRARREVFEPFFTTKTKGTGLGMAIAHRILEAHGGSIAVGDPAQGGAEFILRLPQEYDEPTPADRRG